MNRPRFWRQGSIIIDAENDWQEVGTYQDIAAEVLELRAENARLRAMLPDAETLRAGDRLGAVVTNTIMTPDDYADLTTIRKWLQRLERP